MMLCGLTAPFVQRRLASFQMRRQLEPSACEVEKYLPRLFA